MAALSANYYISLLPLHVSLSCSSVLQLCGRGVSCGGQDHTLSSASPGSSHLSICVPGGGDELLGRCP